MAEIQNCSSEPEPTAINEWEGQASMKSTTQSSEASDTTSSRKENKGKGKAAAFKRRNPRVLVRRHRANNVDTIGLPLGMSFAAVMAQVMYRRDVAAESMSPSHLSMRMFGLPLLECQSTFPEGSMTFDASALKWLCASCCPKSTAKSNMR